MENDNFAANVEQQTDANTGVATGTDATESVNSGQNATEAVNSGQQQAGSASSFPKEAIDEITKLRSRSRESDERAIRAEAERDFLLRERQKQAPPPQVRAQPKPEDFNDPDEYRAAATQWQVDTTVERRLAEERQATDMESKFRRFAERQAKLTETVPDYPEVFRAAPISDGMASEILSSDVSAEITDYLGRNRDEALRIYQMTDKQAIARAIGRIEARIELRATPKPQAGKSPPPPFQPVTGAARADKPLQEMSMDEYATKWQADYDAGRI